MIELNLAPAITCSPESSAWRRSSARRNQESEVLEPDSETDAPAGMAGMGVTFGLDLEEPECFRVFPSSKFFLSDQ
jgi:hypothetical protein